MSRLSDSIGCDVIVEIRDVDDIEGKLLEQFDLGVTVAFKDDDGKLVHMFIPMRNILSISWKPEKPRNYDLYPSSPGISGSQYPSVSPSVPITSSSMDDVSVEDSDTMLASRVHSEMIDIIEAVDKNGKGEITFDDDDDAESNFEVVDGDSNDVILYNDDDGLTVKDEAYLDAAKKLAKKLGLKKITRDYSEE